MAVAMEKTERPLTRVYEWQNLEFNFPVNANENGVVNGDPGELTWRQLEIDWGIALSAELKIKVGGEYFCGISYNPNKPDVCPPIEMDIQKIWMVDREPVKALQQLDKDRDARDIAEEQAKIASDTLAQKTTSQAANQQLADLEILEANKQAEVERAKSAAALEGKKAEAIASDPELAKCLVLIEAVNTCPMIEQSKVQNGNTTVNVSPNQGQNGG